MQTTSIHSTDFFAGLVFSGCASHEIERSPEPVESGAIAYTIASPASTPPLHDWWMSFDDSKLDALVRMALDNNFDIMQGLARLDQADALNRQARVARLPLVDLEASMLSEHADGGPRNRRNRVGGAFEWKVDVSTDSQAYLTAIEDVENTLYRERKQREFLDRLERRRRFLTRTVEETRDRYTNGLTDFLPVLDAIKELQLIERIIVRQERELLGFRIQLHRALGGRINA